MVSVIIPCFNAEKYVREAINSILDQTYRDLEVIVINDGSTDSTGNILKQFALNDSRVIYIENETNLHLIGSLNRGLSNATGEFIARMDADDISMPNRIERQVEYLKNNLQVGVVGTNALLITNSRSNIKFEKPLNDKDIKNNLFIDSPFIHPSVMLRSDLLRRVGGYKAAYFQVEDFGLWVELSATTVFANLPEPLIYYRVLETSETRLSQKNSDLKHVYLKCVFRRLFEIRNIKVDEVQLDNYTYSMFRPNFDKIDYSVLVDVYETIFKTINDEELKSLLSIRWAGSLFYGKKSFTMLKYFFTGLFLRGVCRIFKRN